MIVDLHDDVARCVRVTDEERDKFIEELVGDFDAGRALSYPSGLQITYMMTGDMVLLALKHDGKVTVWDCKRHRSNT